MADMAAPASSAREPDFEVDEQFEEPQQQLNADLAGMWLFLATEIMFFGGLFVGYAMYRLRFPEAFAHAAGHLELWLGTANTILLLTSGLTMALADPAMHANNRRGALAALAATLALGAAFLGIKAWEYRIEYEEGLMPLLDLGFRYEGAQPRQAEMFFNFYYAMTGLHALHMLIGLAALIVLIRLVWTWRSPSRLTRQVRITGLYWGFVDVVWLFVFASLYLLGGENG